MAQGFMLHRRRKVSKAFKTTWNVAVGTLTIPSQTGTYNCTVDWGDGTAPTTHTTGALVHTYTTAGLHQISITGQYNGLYISYGTDRNKLISVDDWGTVGFTSMNSAFTGCNNLASLPQGAITGAGNVTGFTGCFYECKSLTSIPQGLFDKVPNATKFDRCFHDCQSLTSVPQGLFDKVPNATDFFSCFYYCTFRLPTTMFNYAALADKQPDMTYAFYGSPSKTGIAYPLWDYITITSSNGCYGGQTALTNYADIPTLWK